MLNDLLLILALAAYKIGAFLLSCLYHLLVFVVMLFNLCSFDTACDKIQAVYDRFF